MEQPLDSQIRVVTALIWSALALVEILEVQAIHGLEERAASFILADDHLHEWRERGISVVRPFANGRVLILQRFQIKARQSEEGNAFWAADPLFADDFPEMAGAAGLIKGRRGHNPPVIIAVVTG